MLTTGNDGAFFMSQTLETGTGKVLTVMKNEAFYPLAKDEIASFAEEAGFTDFSFYGSYAMEAFTEQSEYLVCALR